MSSTASKGKVVASLLGMLSVKVNVLIHDVGLLHLWVGDNMKFDVMVTLARDE